MGERMKIKFLQEVMEIENQIINIDLILETISNKIEENQLQLSYLLIDGVPLYNDLYSYFLKNIENIEIVEVVCSEIEALVNETLLSSYEYMSKAIPEIRYISDEFYRNPNIKTWGNLADLFEGLQWIIDTAQRIDHIKNLERIIKNYSIWNEYMQSIKNIFTILPELEVAMEMHDHVLIGDLISYEILPCFEVGEEKLRFLIPKEGANYVS